MTGRYGTIIGMSERHLNSQPYGAGSSEWALPVDEDGELPDEPASQYGDRHDAERAFIQDFCRTHCAHPAAMRTLSSRQVQILVRMIEGEWGAR